MLQRLFIFCICFFLNILSINIFSNIIGSGSTSSYPFFQKILNEYSFSENKLISYSPNSSFQGYNDLINKKVNFASVDMFINDSLLNKMKDNELLHIPTHVNALAISFNLTGIKDLNLNSDIISKIYLGEIKFWDNDLIQSLNPSLNLPNIRIVPLYRKNKSGSTYIFSYYLSQTNAAWKSSIGVTPLISLEFGLSADNSSSIANLTEQIEGSISYLGFDYTIDRLNVVSLKNQSNLFIKPSIKTISEATNITIPDDTRYIATNTTAKNGYPITTFTWIIFLKDQNDFHSNIDNAIHFKSFLLWLINDGQIYSKSIGYSPLSKKVRLKAKDIISTMTFKGSKL